MIINGNALHIPLKDESVQCCVTSPPYWNLRNYNVIGQLGMEQSPDEYVQNMVEVFHEVWRVLKKDGVVFLNLGDTYAANRGYQVVDSKHIDVGNNGVSKVPNGLKPKDLVGIPWRVAFALQSDGWWLRSDIIWKKNNCMPESCKDRPTKSHEYVFLLTKSAKYYYDADAIKEPAVDRPVDSWEKRKAAGAVSGSLENGHNSSLAKGKGFSHTLGDGNKRNKRSVWIVNTSIFKGAHFATMPEKLVEPCILAGSKPGDVVLDPFAGSCTVGKVAERYGRDFVGVELNLDYIEIGKKRMAHNQMELAA